MKKEEIKAVVFDIGGVLALSSYSPYLKKGHRSLGVHKFMAKKLKISLDQYFDSIDSTYTKSIEGKITKSKALTVISKNIGISKIKLEKLFTKAYKKKFSQNKKLYKLAFKLKKQGYKIAILSDQWHVSKEALVIKKYIKRFNVVVISCDVGMRKPNTKIYKFLLAKLKLPAKKCIFIDNQKWNLTPAKKLGIKTILFKNNKQLISDLRKFGVEVK